MAPSAFEDSHHEAVQRAIDVSETPEVSEAVRRLRRAAQRALRRDTGGIRNWKALAMASAIEAWMAEEAAELEGELKAIAAAEAWLTGGVGSEITAILRLIRAFLVLHSVSPAGVETAAS